MEDGFCCVLLLLKWRRSGDDAVATLWFAAITQILISCHNSFLFHSVKSNSGVLLKLIKVSLPLSSFCFCLFLSIYYLSTNCWLIDQNPNNNITTYFNSMKYWSFPYQDWMMTIYKIYVTMTRYADWLLTSLKCLCLQGILNISNRFRSRRRTYWFRSIQFLSSRTTSHILNGITMTFLWNL